MKKLSHCLQYLVLRIIETVLKVLPRKLTLKLGAAIGIILFRKGIYRHVAEKNMRHTGLWSEDEIQKITRNLYINIGRYFADFLRASSTQPPNVVHNYESIEKMFARNRGIIILLAHFGNWEILANVFGQKIRDLNVLAKPMKNVPVQDWLAGKRKKTGVETIYVKKSLRKSLQVLKRNGMVAILVDQHVGRQGTMVPFLGKDANTLLGVGWLLEKTGCALLPTYALLQDDGSYKILFENADLPDTRAMDRDQVLYTYQKLHNDIISEWIKKYPDHYFGWFHKRYRDHIKYSS
ncbi:MAG: hypothetical protein GF401_15650 [Chitinivibrionales bacterium]|nr:hypothetical protein [Chitinivibrionales bacterium]